MAVNHADILKSNCLKPACWAVIDEQDAHIVVKHRITGEVRVLDKEGSYDQ